MDVGDDAAQRTTSSRDGRKEKAQWQLKYGFRSEVDLQYDALSPPVKPRLPRSDEATGEWRPVVFPDTLNEFLGNARVVTRVQALERGEVSPKTNVIISGGEGTGKQALLRLVKQILTDLETTTPCVFLTFQAKASSDKELVTKIEHAVNRLDTEKTTVFIVIESFECVPIAVQQHHLLPFLMVCNAKNTFAIVLIRPDASKLPDQLKQRSLHLHLQPLSAPLVRKKLLLVCQHQQIGYTRDGLEELLKRCHSQLLPCIAKLHQVFLAYHFVSLPNVQKALQARKIAASNLSEPMRAIIVPPPCPLSIIRMNEPLRRCKTCTLLPPCAHVTLQNMYDRTDRTRQLYPTRENEPSVIVCPSFTATGICRNIQAIGRCRYAHPHNLHTIDVTPLVKRCDVHTLPLPCLHCTNLSEMKKQLNQEQARCAVLERELRDLKKQLADKETEHYLFVREQSKSVKWGAMRREKNYVNVVS
ncbi:hypothetical protein Poli38472_006395 [Pythium oligandrum]|uniref:C3H1-type domain-containing protein n=1 Tax=Pythium oligandrum TaxID=41045 RepID=A0A8K1FAM3_PYTOL|nr:hypothetical protein Poli38472_006395 [Pythium oligandrum]|eukprot:TMW56385.1 hypothetical protein Poli38472_006395 [Pythium oligandrum]